MVLESIYQAAWIGIAQEGRVKGAARRARCGLDSRHWNPDYSTDLAAGRV